MRIGMLTGDRAYEASRARGAGVEIAGYLEHSLHRLETTIEALYAVFEEDGHQVISLPVNERLLGGLQNARPEIVFNAYFGPARRMDQAHVTSLLEYAGIPFTGAGAACHFLGLSKPLAKRVFAGCGLPTPRFVVADDPSSADRAVEAGRIDFPVIVKTVADGEGIGLDDRSVVRRIEELADVVERVNARFGPALVEEYLPGRKFTVGVLDGRPERVLPILEIVSGEGSIYSYRAKTDATAEEICPADLPAREVARMGDLAVRAGRALGCRDYWRVDFRADARSEQSIMEINTLPGLQPGYSDITRMAEPAGTSYGDLVHAILASAMRRSKR